MIQKVYINIIVELSVQTGGNFYFSSEIIKKKSLFSIVKTSYFKY